MQDIKEIVKNIRGIFGINKVTKWRLVKTQLSKVLVGFILLPLKCPINFSLNLLGTGILDIMMNNYKMVLNKNTPLKCFAKKLKVPQFYQIVPITEASNLQVKFHSRVALNNWYF